MHEAMHWIVQRHPVLRTSFDMSNFSRPLQFVHKEIAVPLFVEDLSSVGPENHEETIAAWLEEEKCNHFKWNLPPLFRITIHIRKEDELQCTLTCHHAVLDGWSVATLLTELIQKYTSLLEKKEFSPEPIIGASFRDFVELEQTAVSSEEHKTYWINKLGNNTPSVLPRWPYTRDHANSYGNLAVQIDATMSAGLQQTAQTLGVSLKSVLLAAHLRVLALLTGRCDVQTGTTTHGRPETADGERILGLFLNMLPFRMQLKPGTWADLVRQVFANELEILPHRRYPMAEIQRELGGDLLFEVIFNFIDFHVYDDVALEAGAVLGSMSFTRSDHPLGHLPACPVGSSGSVEQRRLH
jgi:microcystin synthetase protein McyA